MVIFDGEAAPQCPWLNNTRTMPTSRCRISTNFAALALYGAMLLQGCGTHSGPPPIQPVLKRDHLYQPRASEFVSRPTYGHFSICHGHTCSHITTTGLSDSEWSQVTRELQKPAPDAASERQLIAQAVAALERLVGGKTGTETDRRGNLAGLGQPGQMDCVDEATNTSVYLTMLANTGLLRWHDVQHRTSRGFINLRGPHSTAVIRDRQSGEYYAVDSWFRDNGEPAYVIPLTTWRWGWTPPGW